MNRIIARILGVVHAWASQTDTRELRESTLTVLFAAVIGAMVLFALVPSVKDAVWPVFHTFLSFR